ncbi:hypothetical protein pETSU_028 [Edwardsiella phage pEt-SU]|uniref:Uncharacterized protein n=1 Tax=Edwardsiella phage pEt-SU TaxID=2562142 RepID=A0A4D6DY44_9CAUD|nr:hypothetical protein HOV39_gp028 [Edwardsiella phage pEt-SU]QBZ70609.1 hypothetical protein pETSU_028 [Edwardsiella phage pEt-SU]
MEINFDDIEHYARIVAGCESINNVFVNGGKLTDDGRYAQTVLRVHAQDDLGAFAGNESVGSAIKAGAANVIKWIKEFIKSISNALESLGASFSKSKLDAATKQVKEEIKNDFDEAWKSYTGPLETALAAVKMANDNKSEALGQLNNLDLAIKNLQRTLDSAKEKDISSFHNNLWSATEILRINIPRCNKALEAYVTKEGKKDGEVTQATSNIKGLTLALSKLSFVTKKYIDDAGKMYDKVKAAEKKDK